MIPEQALTKNHQSVKYRLRVQQEREAKDELKAFENDEDSKRIS